MFVKDIIALIGFVSQLFPLAGNAVVTMNTRISLVARRCSQSLPLTARHLTSGRVQSSGAFP